MTPQLYRPVARRPYSLRPRPAGARGLTQPWRSTNGPIRLMQLLGKLPDLIPYTLAVRGPVNTTVANTVQLPDVTVDPEADFYAFSASCTLSNGTAVVGEEGLVPGGGSTGFHNFYWWAKCLIREGKSGIRLSQEPVSVGGIFGYGDRPFYYPVPWIVRGGTTVRVSLRNETTIGNVNHQVTLCWHGFKRFMHTSELPLDFLIEPRLIETFRQYREAGRLGHVEPFFYSLFTGQTALSGAQGAFVPMQTETPTITVADADFACVYLMAEFFDDAGNPANFGTASSGGGALILRNWNHICRIVIDEGASRLDDRPIPMANIFGHGKRWFKLPVPLIVKAGQSLTIIVTPQTVPANSQIWKGQITLAGVRIFPGKTR